MEKHLGPDHTELAEYLNALGELYYEMGEYAKSEPLFQRALNIGEESPPPKPEEPERQKSFQLEFQADKEQILKILPSLADLADLSRDGRISVRIESTSQEGYDSSWLYQAFQEPLGIAEVERVFQKEDPPKVHPLNGKGK